MNRNSILFSAGILSASFLLVDACAQAQATGGNRSSNQKSGQTRRPSGSNIRAEFLKNYVPPVQGLPGFGGGGGGGGGSMKGTPTPSPLGAGHKEPSSYQRKPRAPRSAGAPKSKKPGKPKVMAAVPARPGHARDDRTFVNGLTPQHSRYLGHEGSRVRREPDQRAALAKLAAPSRKPRPARRYLSPNPSGPRRPAAK